MTGIKDINRLLKNMKPELVKGEYVFCSLPNDKLSPKLNPLLIFKESEGITLIIEKKVADVNSIPYSEVWALITLTIHSDLTEVGFLAAITKKLAEAGISVNAVSAYYHDHLFVPINRSKEAMEILILLSK